MSVGYDLEGIKGEKIDHFLNGMIDARETPVFQECIRVLHDRKRRLCPRPARERVGDIAGWEIDLCKKIFKLDTQICWDRIAFY